jgi:hypothetical protein
MIEDHRAVPSGSLPSEDEGSVDCELIITAAQKSEERRREYSGGRNPGFDPLISI